jgi:hypothetical protein
VNECDAGCNGGGRGNNDRCFDYKPSFQELEEFEIDTT